MQFKDIAGHAEIKAKLAQSAANGRISHAQLFLGSEGSGNLALAVAYAQYISCQQRSEKDSCGECPSCIKISKLAHPDLHFSFPIIKEGDNPTSKAFLEKFRAAFLEEPYMGLEEWGASIADPSKNKNMGIFASQCNEIIRDLALKPYESPYKFLILWLPEKIQKESGNKLLKIIEEPPQKTIFILVSNNDENILNTIKSRTQLIKLKKISDFDMLDALSDRYNLGMEKAREIVNIVDGNFLAAKHLVEIDEVNEDYFVFITGWLRSVYTASYVDLMKYSDQFAVFPRDYQKTMLEYAVFILRESIANNVDKTLMRVTDKEKNFLANFAKLITPDGAAQVSKLIEESIYQVERNAHPKILLTNLAIQIHKHINPKINR